MGSWKGYLDGLFEGGCRRDFHLGRRFRWRLALGLSELDLDEDLMGLYAFT
jgi:hypothetical protein